jgi:hypothetical protein
LNCQHVCRTNCAVKGGPIIQGFTENWREPEYFSTHVLPEPILREATKEQQDEGMMLVQTRAAIRANAAPRAVMRVVEPQQVARNVDIATFDE